MAVPEMGQEGALALVPVGLKSIASAAFGQLVVVAHQVNSTRLKGSIVCDSIKQLQMFSLGRTAMLIEKLQA